MKNTLLALFCIGTAIATFSYAADDGSKAVATLAGTWSGHRLAGGMDEPEKGPELTLTISEEKVVSDKPGLAGTFTVDTSTQPHHMNGIKDAKSTYEGIVEVKGKTLIWCVGDPGKPRPTTFETKPGQWCMVLNKK